MLGGSTLYAFAPAAEAGGFQFLPHEADHFIFGQSELLFNGFEGGTVFPGHFDDAICIDGGEELGHR